MNEINTMVSKSIILTLLLISSLAGVHAQDERRILVGPNILVSREGEKNREVTIAADPTNPKRLLGAADVITPSGLYAGPSGARKQRLYLSVDRGNSWRPVRILNPDSATEIRALDPHVEFAPDGTAYFIGLPDNEMVIYRSTNGGTVWEKAAVFPETTNFRAASKGYDYELLTFDHTGGRFAGRSYISVVLKGDEDAIAVFRSDDGWRTRSGPVIVDNIRGRSGGGLNSRMLQTLSDGTLGLILLEWGTDKKFFLKLATSDDGGVTFSSPRPIPGTEMASGWQAAAIDNSVGPYRDRIYVVFETGSRDNVSFPSVDPTKKRRTVMFIRSEDRGRTWSKPQPLDPNAGTMSDQFLPTIAVNRDGAVAVTWYDTRKTPAGAKATLMDYYMTASIDGGKSFLPSVRVSSESTDIVAMRKLTTFVTPRLALEAPRLHFVPGDAGGGYGHYMGMTADVEGVFHPFWQDGRTGVDQIWTARVEVSARKPTLPTGSTYLTEVAAGDASEPSQDLIESDISAYMAPCVDPFRQNSPADAIEVPIRFKNTSNRPIYGPLRVEVATIEAGTSVVNSNNGKAGIGATLDYTHALGDFETLPPGGVTNAILWRFKRSPDIDRMPTPSVIFRVFGRIDKSRRQAPLWDYCQ